MPGDRVLIRGGYVLSMDDAVGDVRGGDVLVEADEIAAVGVDLAVDGAEVIDATGMIVMPGMVDGHKHAWQSIFRGTCGDQTLNRFFGEAVPATAPHLTPEDIYASTLLGAVDALDAGVTTILDWCHATLTPAHARAGVTALRDSGVRAWFAHGRSLLTWSDRRADHTPDIRDLRSEAFASDAGLVRLAMAARGPMFADLDVTERDFALARELGIPISVHVDMPSYAGDDVVALDAMGALGPDVTLLHGNTLTDRELDLAIAAGCRFVDSSVCDVLMGIGQELTERLLARGIPFGISPDSAVVNTTDLFWVMRATVLLERSRVYGPIFAAGRQPVDAHLTARRMLELATQGGAHAVWLEDRIGSLTPGKQADVVLLRTRDVNMLPLNDPTEAVVFDAGVQNVDTVLVGGRVVKREGRLVGVDLPRLVRLATEARDRVLAAADRDGYRPWWFEGGAAA
jgi:cytosine/adenosine deaminase-related metal-dependent hydrolase